MAEEADEDEADEDEEEEEELAGPVALALRASGVKRLIGRFFRFPRPRHSSTSSTIGAAPLHEEQEEDDTEEDKVPCRAAERPAR